MNLVLWLALYNITYLIVWLIILFTNPVNILSYTTKPFIHHLHIIYAQVNYTYMHMYKLKHIYNLKALKLLKPTRPLEIKIGV